MKKYAVEIVFESLEFDFVPMEKVIFNAGDNTLEIVAEKEDDSSESIFFKGVSYISFTDNESFDMEMFCPEYSFLVTLYKMTNKNIYFFPTDEKVWEIHTVIKPTLEI